MSNAIQMEITDVGNLGVATFEGKQFAGADQEWCEFSGADKEMTFKVVTDSSLLSRLRNAYVQEKFRASMGPLINMHLKQAAAKAAAKGTKK